VICFYLRIRASSADYADMRRWSLSQVGEAGVRTVAHGFTRGKTRVFDLGARFSAREKAFRAIFYRPLKRAPELGRISFPRLKAGATVLTPASPAAGRTGKLESV
jgi:hypothetical protein